MNYLWTIMLVISSFLGAYSAKLSNNNIPYGNLYVFLCGMFGIFLWMWVAKISKNLLFDSVLYDIILTTVFTLSFIILKCGTAFAPINWIGLALAIIGLILMKI